MKDGRTTVDENSTGSDTGTTPETNEGELVKRTRDLGTIRIYRKFDGPVLVCVEGGNDMLTKTEGIKYEMLAKPVLIPIDHPEFKATAEADKWLNRQEHLRDGKYAIERDIVERTVGTVSVREVK